jgi:phospholipid/cholesterol/gamma-HCH transport system ATP-binding protein
MQKRAALARAIAVEPEVLLFDEPTSGLDPITGGKICNLLKDTVRDLGVTSLTITHDLKVAEFLADRVSIINSGKVVWTGHTDDMKNCDDEFVEEFYRASSVIRGTIQQYV